LPDRDTGNGPPLASDAVAEPVYQLEGLTVRKISFEGVDPARLAPLPGQLPQAAGVPLSLEKLKSSLRELFATGQYEDIQVEGLLDGDGVDLVFRGAPRAFIGTVSVGGAKGATLNTQLQHASQLTPGTRYTAAKLNDAIEQMRRALATNGFNEPTITQTLTPHPQDQLVDIAFHVVNGPRARVGSVQVTGDSGMSLEEFRRHAHLRSGSHVDHDTASRALAGILKRYQSQERLEAEIKLEAQQYAPATKRDDFRFSANPGPVVKVLVQGVSMSPERIKRVIPIFEEGTVDDDLLNEGNRRLRDFYQRLGYFDIKVDHEEQASGANQVVILYKVQLGPRRRVESVSVSGNRYFDSATLKELLSVHPADVLDRQGTFSQALVSADISALQAVYQNNGFSKAKVTEETGTGAVKTPAAAGKKLEVAPLAVVYKIDEGKQMRVGSVRLEGNQNVADATLTPLLNTAPGQLLSPHNLAGDRDALFTDYLSRGFRQVQVDVSEQIDWADPNQADFCAQGVGDGTPNHAC
jgi:outer membrane protein assembly factor BamA